MLSRQHHVETLLSVRKVYEASEDYKDAVMHCKKKGEDAKKTRGLKTKEC